MESDSSSVAKIFVGGPAWIANAEPPRQVALVASHVEIAARLDHEVGKASGPQDGHGPVHGVALADAAEVDAHAGALQQRGPGGLVEDDRAVVHERQPRRDLGPRRDAVVLIVVELPDVRQRAERDVELAAGPFADLERLLAAPPGCRELTATGAGRQRRSAARTSLPSFHTLRQAVQPIELGERGLERGRTASASSRGPRRQLDGRAHRGVFALHQPWLSRSRCVTARRRRGTLPPEQPDNATHRDEPRHIAATFGRQFCHRC